MEIELRRVSYNPRLDESAFAANLFINGEKAATVTSKNDRTQYYATDEIGMDLVAKAEVYLNKLPGEKKVIDGKEQTIKQSLVLRIESLFADYLSGIELKKFGKKVEQMQKRNIVIGVAGKYIRTHALKIPVDMLVQSDAGKLLVQEALSKKVMPTLIGHEHILNTNIPVTLLQAAGLHPLQFSNTEAVTETKKNPKKISGNKL